MNRNGKKRIIIILLAFVMTAGVFGFLQAPAAYAQAAGSEDEAFDGFLMDEWVEMMESDYATMHSSVKDYRAMGLQKPEVTLGEISYEAFAEGVESAEASLDTLHTFDFDSLSPRQQTDYLVYEYELETYIGQYSYPDYIEMFRPYIGSLASIKDYFPDFKFYTEEDIEDYLTLLGDLPRYMDQMKDFTDLQAEKGYFMEDDSIDEALDDMDDFLGKGEENELIVSFDSRIDAFEGADEAKKSEWKERDREIVMDRIFPAYEDAETYLEGMYGSRCVAGSMFEYPDGEEYYRWLARYSCSSDESVEEMFDFLTKAVRDAGDYYDRLLEKDESFSDPADIEGMETLDEVVAYLESHLDEFPEGPDIDVTLSYIEPGVAEWAMAYYLPAPVDDINENVIRVNADAVEDINTLYYTLAHEGFPGHMYQMTWYQNEGGSPLRHDLVEMGYEEGWANYVERIMLERSGLDRTSAEVIAMDEFLGYTAYAAADLAVNGMGYNTEELERWLEKVNLPEDFAQDLYDSAIAMPGTYLSYGYGEAKFWSLRGRAEAALGDAFDPVEFHRVILEGGARPFEMVEEDVAAYTASYGENLPDEVKLFTAAGKKTVRERKLREFIYEGKEFSARFLKPVIAVAAFLLLIVLAAAVREIVRSRRKD